MFGFETNFFFVNYPPGQEILDIKKRFLNSSE